MQGGGCPIRGGWADALDAVAAKSSAASDEAIDVDASASTRPLEFLPLLDGDVGADAIIIPGGIGPGRRGSAGDGRRTATPIVT